MAYHVDAIANYFLKKAESESRRLDQMQIQKLAYYAQGWHLGIYGAPLFSQTIQAWRHGPVISDLRDEFRSFGHNPITEFAKETVFQGGRVIVKQVELADYDDTDHDRTKSFLDKIWSTYGKLTGTQLSKMTHETGTPWHGVLMACAGDIPTGTSIPNESIKEYFEARAKAGANGA